MVDMVVTAKRILAGEPTQLTKKDFHTEIEARAAQYRLVHPEISPARAYVKVAHDTPEGVALWRAMRNLEGADCDDHEVEPARKSEPAPSPSLTRLNELAEEARKIDPKLTFARAFTKVLTDPANAGLKAQEMVERRERAAAG